MASRSAFERRNPLESREFLWGQMLQEADSIVNLDRIEELLRSGGGVIICGLEDNRIIFLEEGPTRDD